MPQIVCNSTPMSVEAGTLFCFNALQSSRMYVSPFALDGRRLRVDATAVETNIHYPTNSGLLGDNVRVFARLIKKVTRENVGETGTKLQIR